MASPNERLLYAAKTDNSDMLDEVFSLSEGEWDVNFQDGLGNTALHYAASTPAPSALEMLLEREGTDVDLQNRLEGATPLHLAVKLEHERARQGVVEMLLEAGADPRIKDRHASLPADYLSPYSSTIDKAILEAIEQAIAEFSLGGVDSADIADDSDGESGSGSGTDED